MTDQHKSEVTDQTTGADHTIAEDRRAFLLTARKVAVVAPAAALLLAATSAKAAVLSGRLG